MTGNPRRDAKISIIGLVLFALLGLVGVGYLLDRWFIGGGVTQRVAAACQSLVKACSTAISPVLSYLPGARVFLLSVSLAALGFALIKAVGVIFFARRIKAAEGTSVEAPARVLKAAREIGADDVSIRYIDTDDPIAYTDGLLRSVIHISRGLVDAVGDSQLKGIMAHEYAHVKRRDNVAIFAALVLRDFLFVFPLSHLLFAVFMRQKEHAADDLAAELTGDPVGIAEAIVKVARLKSEGPSRCPAYATFFPDKAAVRDRVNRLIGTGAIARIGLGRMLTATAVTVAIIGALAGIATAQPDKARLSKECQNKPQCVRQAGACCVK
ncbi:MAG: M56 family metallopeptidase [Actinobacteria bacterium]|nr:M56 family metallopeptidase [Actinomycetota bacterium]